MQNGASFTDMPKPLLFLQRLLLKRPGDDREVLAYIPIIGLAAVLAAADEGRPGIM
ncbi:hypothetical protein MGMO_9c00100 [Methyloglobulus morosus KoM1]|uniref:Uncharacterized protein n=1 Tax=Methyloglobulus morosus KoM1 TaxID=1116472 RepID=V5C147_9GAMM|nr:hypothetical protein [Methyloglobulus morosus]ESS73814.1 hypothetical protein MGMO_9c00100 [Methyloglobulus morosus KoM1]